MLAPGGGGGGKEWDCGTPLLPGGGGGIFVTGGGGRLLVVAIFDGLGSAGAPGGGVGVAFLHTCLPSNSAMNDM